MSLKKEGKVLPKISLANLERDIAVGIAKALRADFPTIKTAAAKLAEQVDINMETLKKWYNGRHTPSAANLILLARSSPAVGQALEELISNETSFAIGADGIGCSLMTPDILQKLTNELNVGITTEVQVVYVLVGIRKLIERDAVDEQYANLKFHCDWALHSSMNRAAAKAILKQFNDAHILLQGDINLEGLPSKLKAEIDRISQMKSFKDELSQFLKAYDLPSLAQQCPDGWPRFLYLYAKVVEDIPLLVSPPTPKEKAKNISHVIVRLESAQNAIKSGQREEMLFKVTWVIHDKNGQSGSIFVINSFSLNSERA